MDLTIQSIFALILTLMGLASSVLIFNAQKNLSKGQLKQLLTWLFLTVLVCGFPYALWTFLTEANIIVIQDIFTRQLPGMILVFLFFGFMLRTAMIAKKLGDTFSFNDASKRIAKELKK